ncbi:MAG TPA: ribosome small subunit-dependent GTPase A [Acidimicrobiales bacterium]|nr:ribosome small subunit-dependent GTPase A [Acidimicrobiales bacterium]
MSYATLEPYGWSDRWQALLASIDPSAAGGLPAGDPLAGGSPGDGTPGGDPLAGGSPGDGTPGGDSLAGGSPGDGEGSSGDASQDGDAAGRGSPAGREAPIVPGRVISHQGVAVTVALPDGLASRPLRRGLDPAPVVGDWVVERGGALLAVLPRASLLERRAMRREQPQALAANVDVVLVVCGLDRPVKAGRIRRTATLAWEAGAVPTVVLTKADTRSPGEVAETTEQVVAENPGLDVIVTSSPTGMGLDAVREAVTGRTVVLLGESGAGKSSLVNALLDDAGAAEVGAVRAGDAKGRHTTTGRQLHLLPGGGVVVDTPGIRSVGLWADTEAVTTTFEDIDDLATQCRFANCGHDSEPGCAVRAAIEAGDLAAERLESWRALEREAVAAERRADPQAQRQWGRSFSRVAREAQRRKGRT